MKKLRENIRAIRLARSLPQQAVADELGLDVSAVCNFENGKRDFRIGNLPAIAAALGVEVLDLFTWPKRYGDMGSRLYATKDCVRVGRDDEEETTTNK